MNCRSFRKFVGAFADGELDTQANAEALEHLNMCPTCAQRVADVQQLKQAIVRSMGQETAPEHLRAKVEALVASRTETTGEPTGSAMGRLVYRLMVPLGIAAAIVMSIAVWEWATPGDVPLAPGIKTVRDVRLASEVRNQHRMCMVHVLEHHDRSLGRGLNGISRRLTDRLKLRAIAPDLADHGFALVGADQCGVMGRPGGHVLYRKDDGAMLSVFSTALADCDKVSLGRSMRHQGMEFTVDQRDNLAVVAWSQGCAMYIFCGQVPVEQVLEAAADARRALDQPSQASERP